jgi:ABC-2 type transport system permease protein
MTTTTASARQPSAAIASAPVPVGVGKVGQSLAFAHRAVLRIRHVPEQLSDVLGVPIIFTVMFTYLFGGALASSPTAYLHYLLPGTLVMAVVLVTMYSGVSLNSDLASGVSDRYRSMPVWRPAPIVGAMVGDLARYLLAAALVVGLGLLLGYRPAGGPGGVVAGVALVIAFASALSWVWTTLGLVLRSPQAVMSLGFLVQVPLTMASNVFVDPRTMPGWLQAFVDVNPVSHLVTAARGLMSGTPDGGELAWVLAGAGGLVAVFAPLTLWLYARKG